MGGTACCHKGVCLVFSELDEAVLEGVHDTAPYEQEELVLAGRPHEQDSQVDACSAPQSCQAHYEREVKKRKEQIVYVYTGLTRIRDYLEISGV